MIPQFDHLSAEEREFMHKAPILVCILIAGADGNIDRNEIREAMAQAQKKQKNASLEMQALYQEIGEDFEDKLKMLLRGYPIETTQRNPMIAEELDQLNALLARMDAVFAKQFYQSICDLAMKVAQSSGGLLGMNSIGADEAMYVKLPMIKDPSVN